MTGDKNIILVVEDNQDDEELLKLALNSLHISNPVVVKRDGAAVIGYLSALESGRENRPSLILLDLRLPKVNGFGVLREIRANLLTRFVPVVVLTSSSQAEDVAQSYAMGANSYISKPTDYCEYKRIISCMTTYWLQMNRISGI